jgi:hypothetical protein
VNNPELILSLLAKRRELQVAADAITALVTALDVVTPAAVIPETVSTVTSTAEMFPTPHGDPA